MRVIRNGNTPGAQRFTEFLVRENSPNSQKIPNSDLVRIPDNLLIPPNTPETPQTLIDIAPEIFSGTLEKDSAILTPKNIDVYIINATAIKRFKVGIPIISLYSTTQQKMKTVPTI